MKILATSDLHGNLPDGFDNLNADVLVVAGDLTMKHKNDVLAQAQFINNRFDPWCERMKEFFTHIVVIAGNHDVVWERNPEMITPQNYIYLQDSGTEIDGVSFWGTPWTIPFFDWGFNGRDEVRKNAFDLIPLDVDVLISHGPPRLGNLDVVQNIYSNDEVKYTGDPLLNSAIIRTSPSFFFCGHIHEGKDLKYNMGISEIYNVCYVDEQYRKSPKGSGYAYVEI